MNLEGVIANFRHPAVRIARRNTWLVLAIVGSVVQPGLAQFPDVLSLRTEARLTRSDKSFLRSAAEENEAAIELGQVAEQKGLSTKARNFARTLVAQRSRAQRELMSVARTLGLALPRKLSRSDRKLKQQMEKHAGAELDRIFLSRMAEDLDRQYGSYEDAAMSTQNPAVKDYIENLLPDVKRQDQVAKAIAPGEGAGSGNPQ